LHYCPPEIIDESDIKSDPKIDIWALGVILYIILLKKFPFRSDVSNSDIREQILSLDLKYESREEMKLSCSVKHLISNMLTKNKFQRYSIKEIVSHPWLIKEIEEIEESPLSRLTSNFLNDEIAEQIKSVVYPTCPDQEEDTVQFLGERLKSRRTISRNMRTKSKRKVSKILSPLKSQRKNNKKPNGSNKGSKIKIRMKNSPQSIIHPMQFKINCESYMSARKKRKRGGRTQKSELISKFKESQNGNNYLVGMEYCLFKREVDDNKILETFLLRHSLEYNEYNVKTLREFAQTSIESPIDFKNIITRMQKKSRRRVHNESRMFHQMSTIAESSAMDSGPCAVYKDVDEKHDYSKNKYSRSMTNKIKFSERVGDISMRK